MDEATLKRLKQRYGVIGNNPALNRALDIAIQVAPTDLSVLVTGENGTGKEIFARIIHDNSIRKNKKFLTINCGSIPEGTIDSELFGHEKGAFTDAVNEREGYFGVADGGTLFLDEVGELPLSTQARLLRVLETGEYIRVGSSQVRKTNVRIVAATNVNIPVAITERRFREDLYYRLNTIPIHVPPLRERGEDIKLLFMKFALEMSEKYHMPTLKLTEDSARRLMEYSWPGNIRQLKNVTENMSITAETREVTSEILDAYIPVDRKSTELVLHGNAQEHSYDNEREYIIKFLLGLRDEIKDLKESVSRQEERLKDMDFNGCTSVVPEHAVQDVRKTNVSYPSFDNSAEYVEDTQEATSIADYEKNAIVKALQRHGGKRTEAAADLKISLRTLYRKLKEYDID